MMSCSRILQIAVLLALVPACRLASSPTRVGSEACAAQVRAAPRLDVLTSTAAGTMTLVFDQRALIGRPEQRMDCLPATLDGADVRLQPFGNLSSQVCVFPKLFLHAGGQKTVLITHCNEREAVGTHLPTGIQVYGHELAYRLPHVFDIPALRTRPARMRYVDAPTRTFVGSRPAFFLEHLDDMLLREGLLRVTEDLDSYTAVEVNTLARLHSFQILINNRDWRVIDLTPVEARLSSDQDTDRAHNIFLVKNSEGQILPVPYDLELSGFVGVPPGIRLLVGGSHRAMLQRIAAPEFLSGEPWLVRWTAVRLLHFRRRFAPPVQDAAIQLFLKQAGEARRLLADAPVPEHTLALASQQVEAFYRALQLTPKMPVVLEPVDLRSAPGGPVICKGVPAGTPVDRLESKGEFTRIRLLHKLRLDGKSSDVMCARAQVGWLPSRAVLR